MQHSVDIDLSATDLTTVTSADGVAALLTRMGYPTDARKTVAAAALGLAGDSGVQHIELLSEDADGFLRTYLVQVKSVTAKNRNDLVRLLGRLNQDHLLILTKDYAEFEFDLIVKVKHQRNIGDDTTYRPTAKTISVRRNTVDRGTLRVLRRFTWTASDGLAQYDKLRSVFEAAAYAGEYFQNRALFADHYLTSRLHTSPQWAESPNAAFAAIGQILRSARTLVLNQPEPAARQHLFEPLFAALGFGVATVPASTDGTLTADYVLHDASGQARAAALVYQWDRWLDGPDDRDPHTPAENPGAAVVSLLDQGEFPWVIVTNGRQWRLYSKHAHSRATNFYEVELDEALGASDGTDPNEAFRYFWLFFRPQAFAPSDPDGTTLWLDAVVQGSRDYAREVERELKQRVFERVVPFLAQGFLADRSGRLGRHEPPGEAELETVRQATLTLLYRLLFLLYAESRDLLPVRESAYAAISLKAIKDDVAAAAGTAESESDERLRAHFDTAGTGLYQRLNKLCAVMDAGDATVNVPTYNGGLFRQPAAAAGDDPRAASIATFLAEHHVPDLHLAIAVDHLARVPDPAAGFGLANVDYKSLGVRQLGSIYEGLLEYKLFVADQELVEVKVKSAFAYKPEAEVTAAAARRGRRVAAGAVYLANDKSERKATGSYYTPQNIVQYIVAHTVGPVLQRKLDALVADFRTAEQTYGRELSNAKSDPRVMLGSGHYTAGGKVPPEAMRAWAADRAYEQHRPLVDQLFDLKVLDPAMGSGHFLVEAVDFVTDKLLVWLNRFRPFNPVRVMLDRTRRNVLESLNTQGVNVDPDRLTDVHLLKRHVLKRCIYGVDLNPLATELAKVSLWLDAFTLGAPLSFLDHHLRAGNSLVGATFADLQQLTSGSLFAINYEPMLRAVRNVLMVSRLADTTASEVHKSAAEYAAARAHLDGYRLVLDLIVARHFGVPKGTELITQAGDLKLDSREQFLLTLGAKDAELVRNADAASHQQRYFHWELEFPEVFFGYRAGSRQQIERKQQGEAGFDCVVGNPPYDVISERETQQEVASLQRYVDSSAVLAASKGGKNNLYKLFVCQFVAQCNSSGQYGLIVPMTLLGDAQALGLRRRIFETSVPQSIDCFPQKDDPARRVFAEAKLATVVFVARRTDVAGQSAEPFPIQTHSSNLITDVSALRTTAEDVARFDPENLTIVTCKQEDWDLATRILHQQRSVRLGEAAQFYQGELNETNEKAAGNLVDDATAGPKALRASALCLYAVREPSQERTGALFVDVRKYLKSKRDSSKAFAYLTDRVGVQGNAPQNNFRRLIASFIPRGTFCLYTINYVPQGDSRVPLQLLLAALNSVFCDWYFRLGSTNAHTNQYQLHSLPFPKFADLACVDTDAVEIAAAVDAGDAEKLLAIVRPSIDQVPVSPTIRQVLISIVDEISMIEIRRGDMSRSDRAELSAGAQRLQDVVDHIWFRLMGISHDEEKSLRERYASML